MFKLNIIIISLCYVFGVSMGLPHVLGQCDPDTAGMPNFDIERFVGLWYSIEMFPTYRWYGKVEASCSKINLKWHDNVLEVVNTQVNHKMLETIEGTAVITSTDGSAKFALTIPDPGTDTTKTIDIWVLDTDYLSYALVYSCSNVMLNTMLVGSWKLSRSTQLPQWANSAIDAVIANTDVNPVFFVPVDQSAEGCFYYPFLQPGVPVVLPGQCNFLIDHKEINFSQFLGKWYEIESYPQERSTGQCITHMFTADSNSQMNLVSSRVIDQHLITTNAVVSSTGVNGILTLTMPTNTTNSIELLMWILDTDYNSYALAYTCSNRVDGRSKIVMSWQLSRTPNLTLYAQSIINSAIANSDDLDQRYYEQIDQSNAACFYMPDVQPSEPVIFPGQCDDRIMPVQNFNLLAFLGPWTLIASYDLYEGTCVDITFSLSDDGLIVVAINEVINQQQVTRTGSAVISSNDGSGRLIVSFPGTYPSEYLILGTDYMTYALLYSCENISSNRRIVSSWQMSRSKTLPDMSSLAINQIINSIDVLDNRYYFHMDHTDDACFYHSPPNGNTPVVFRGQCDTTIPVLANFDVQAYMGRWYNIEAYPTPYKTGNCSKADYSMNDDFIHIENNQIVDQVLESWIGFAVIASVDASAKLVVTFSINGVKVSAPYWVLATDYISYSLVYSCINLDAETKAVYSAKLSRTGALSSAASTVMNAVISTIPELHQLYYIPISHAEEDCLHYTNYDENGVVLDGQCLDESLTPAMAFFNPHLFIGDWYEIARYPSSIQQGVCVSNRMLLSPIVGWEVTHSTVRDQESKTIIIPAAIPTDGRGVIGAHVNGVPFDKIYILATDYREYALAYSCRNVDSHTKQIYSWKLSRSRSGLSALANVTIEYIIHLHPDLWEGYYQNTRQDDKACLLYSDVDQNPQYIELPGLCPENIRGVPNFDIRAYLGRWYETARYPTPEQLGQCSRVDYNLLFQLDVTKTEVVEQTSRTQTGYAGIANDGSGLMNVVFNVDGEVRMATHYILATDYTSYSLVYSCTNLDNGNRRVTSWKLSRMPTLSSEASAAMSSIIAATPGLLEEYYQPTSQSDKACFYSQG